MLVPSTDEQNQWLVERADGSHGTLGSSGNRVVVPISPAPLPDELQPVGNSIEAIDASSHGLDGQPDCGRDGTGCQHVLQVMLAAQTNAGARHQLGFGLPIPHIQAAIPVEGTDLRSAQTLAGGRGCNPEGK